MAFFSILALGVELLVLIAGYFVLKAHLKKVELREGQADSVDEESAASASKTGPQSNEKEAPPAGEQRNEKSLSAIYAERNRLWVCPFCETLNAKDAVSCAACGKRR